MKKGDLIAFDKNHDGCYGTIISTYSKPVWGDSGHPDDIEIASMIKVLLGPNWGEHANTMRNFRWSHLQRIASVVQ